MQPEGGGASCMGSPSPASEPLVRCVVAALIVTLAGAAAAQSEGVRTFEDDRDGASPGGFVFSSTVQVSALPRGVLIEIDAVAAVR